MPTTVATEIEVIAPVVIVDGDTPPPPFPTWCDWARDGYYNALAALKAAGSGIKAYHIGTRGLEYLEAGNIWAIVDQWRKLMEYYCGASALPPAITGRDTACRIILRDV